MSSFRNAPRFCPSILILATPADVEGMWECQGLNGDEFMVPDTNLRTMAHPIQRNDNNGAGVYAMVIDNVAAQGYRIDHVEGVVEFEDGESKPLKEFVETAVRVDDQGRTICSFMDPLHEQHQACRERNAYAHILDIQETIAAARQKGFTPEVGMYDIITSGLEDHVSFFERMQAAMAPSWSDDAIESLERTGAPAQTWTEIKDHPGYTNDQVRVMFRNLMEPYIGEFPVERVKMIAAEPGSDLCSFIELALPRLASNEPFRAPNLIVDYETSEVEVFGDEHVGAIVFSDVMGVYAYAWPKQPGHELDADLGDGAPAP